MNWYYPFLIVLIGINLILGFLVFFTNYRSSVNQQFLLVAVSVSLWQLCVGSAFISKSAAEAILWIQLASAIGSFHPFNFNLLRRCILEREKNWISVFRGTYKWFLGATVIAALCFSPSFLPQIIMPGAKGGRLVPEPLYGPGFLLYNIYYIITVILLIFSFVRDTKRSKGIKRIEVQFIMLGTSACVLVGAIFALIIPLIIKNSQSILVAPFCAVFLVAIIAYGIATKKILNVNHFLRRTTAYLILLIYLGALYLLCWNTLTSIIPEIDHEVFPFAHLVSTIVVALSVAPAHGRMQHFANRLFINAQAIAVEDTLQNANSILQSVTRLDDLLKRFGSLIEKAMGTDRVWILWLEDGRYMQSYPEPSTDHLGTPIQFMCDDPLPKLLKETSDPLVVELLVRHAIFPHMIETADQLRSMGIAVALGVRFKGELQGIMFLGPRLSGHIYGAMEQDVLKLLGNQLGVAIENAKLYTEVQDGKIYNNILLDSLVSGVIAVNRKGQITVFNREAQRITQCDADESIGKPVQALPDPLDRVLQDVLENEHSIRDVDHVIHISDSAPTPVRISTTSFRGHQGDVIGALAVFSDTTHLKALEQQVRRHDRLASIGTLSAGMAHEIKNPLVSIKTFTELLPERYDDPDFRETFSSLVGSEVKRIDRIVNQLLRFARPAKAHLVSTSLHDILDNTLHLVRQQLKQKNIRLTKIYQAPHDVIQGDFNLLEQAFINFFLNSIDAMDVDGELKIRTREIQYGGRNQQGANEEYSVKFTIQVTIEDTGKGIREEDIPHVFDPFFTTKSSGTGLGLAVSHGIIDEHFAQVTVQSQLNQGTTFQLTFPLEQQEAPVC